MSKSTCSSRMSVDGSSVTSASGCRTCSTTAVTSEASTSSPATAQSPGRGRSGAAAPFGQAGFRHGRPRYPAGCSEPNPLPRPGRPGMMERCRRPAPASAVSASIRRAGARRCWPRAARRWSRASPRPAPDRCRRRPRASAPLPAPAPLSPDQVSTATVDALQDVLARAVPGGVRPALDRHQPVSSRCAPRSRGASDAALPAPRRRPGRPGLLLPVGGRRGLGRGPAAAAAGARSSARPAPWSCWPTRSATPCTTGSASTRSGRATRPGTRRSCSRRWPTASPGWRSRTWSSSPGPGLPIGLDERDQALLALVGFRDPLGVDAGDAGAHGNAFDRVSAFQTGYARRGRAAAPG